MSVVYYLLLGLISFLGVVKNMFFALCVLRDKERRFKQPLMFFICSTLAVNGLFQAMVLLPMLFTCLISNKTLETAYYAVLIFSSYYSMSSCVWLSIFYYTKIVLNQRPFFIWMRRNIKLVLYSCLLVDRLFLLLDACAATYEITQARLGLSLFSNTSTYDGTMEVYLSVFRHIHPLHMFLFIVMMAASSGATLVYLRGHMKSMEGTSSFSSPLHKSQMRVTIMSLIHTLLYFLYALWVTGCSLVLDKLDKYNSTLFSNLYHMFASLYSLGITVNLGFGQPIFRQKTANIFKRIKSIFVDLCTKIPKLT